MPPDHDVCVSSTLYSTTYLRLICTHLRTIEHLKSQEMCHGISAVQGAHAQFAAAEARLDWALENSLADAADNFAEESDEEATAADGDESYPDNFSRVDLSLSDTEIARHFPSFPVNASPCPTP